MTDDQNKKITIGHVAAFLALPVLVIMASISASNTQQDMAAMDNPAAIYGVVTPASVQPAGE